MNKRIRKKQSRRHGNRCPKCGSGNVVSTCGVYKSGGRWREGPHFVSCFTCDPEMRAMLAKVQKRFDEGYKLGDGPMFPSEATPSTEGNEP